MLNSQAMHFDLRTFLLHLETDPDKPEIVNTDDQALPEIRAIDADTGEG